jgi:hypothetical protein
LCSQIYSRSSSSSSSPFPYPMATICSPLT